MRFIQFWQKLLDKISKKDLIAVAFIFITLVFWAIRLWRFKELMTFSSDQALFLNEVWQMVDTRRISLVGSMVISKIVEGRGFFTGPLLYYLLTPLAFLTNWDVVGMTKLFMIVWWLTGVSLFFWIGRSKGWWIGLSAYLLYTVFPYLLTYNRLLWNPNFLPLLGVFFFWLLFLIRQESKLRLWLDLGLVVGLGINFHYGALVWVLIVFWFWLYGLVKKKWGWVAILLLVLGIMIGDLPWFLFELRHNFYNLRTMIFFLSYSQKPEIDLRSFAFPLTPLVFWAWGALISLFVKKSKFLALFLFVLIFGIFLLMIDWSQTEGVGMPKNWNVLKQKEVAKMICKDIGNYPFEVAATINGDTRATDLRWWLGREGCQPMGVEDYQSATILYLVAPESRPPEKETVWEIQSLRPFKIEKEVELGDKYIFYKLRRLPFVLEYNQ